MSKSISIGKHALAVTGAMLLSSGALAQNIVSPDGTWTASLDPNGTGQITNLFNAAGVDHLFETLWYEASSLTGGVTARVENTYVPVSQNVGPNGATFQLRRNDQQVTLDVVVTMLSGPNGGARFSLRWTNSGPEKVIKPFSYADLDVGGTAAGDDSQYAAAIQSVVQSDPATNTTLYFGGTETYKSWELDLFPILRDNLDAGRSQLTSAGGGVNADWTAALSGADQLLRPGESLSMTFQIGGQAMMDDRGACCLKPECLENLTRGDCLLLGGEYLGDGTGCAGVQCGVGACCFGNQCVENVEKIECLQSGGVYLGDGEECQGVDCRELGACCLPAIMTEKGSVLPDPPCCVTTADFCISKKEGTFLGVGVPCATVVLQPVHVGPRQDWTHIIRVESNCPGEGDSGNQCVDGPYHVDPWVTSGSLSRNCHDFSIVCPLPADFMAPGSDPFTDVICFKGEPIGDINLPGFGVLNFGEADTLVRREFDPFDACDPPGGGSVDVPIELIALNLVSNEPVIVTYNGGQNPEEWDARITVDPDDQPGGTLTATKEHANGGTFDSSLDACPTFTFRRRSDGRTIELDYCASCDPGGIPMESDDIPWATFVRGNVDIENPVCSDFTPGIADGEPTQDGDCNDNGVFDGNFSPCDADNTCDVCGDVTGDGLVTFQDLVLILGNWGGGPRGDTNCDGLVDFQDVLRVLGNWTG